MIKIYVINLERSIDRRNNVLLQFDALGIRPEFINAIDGKAHNHVLFNNYNEELRLKTKGKSLTRGQLGCFASHYLAWERCVQDKMPVIILEDDVLFFKEKFLSFLKLAELLDNRYECIRLFDNQSKHHKAVKIENINEFCIAKFTKGHMRATGYYINPNGAEKLLRKADTWFLTNDIYMDRFWDHGVECYGTIPACLTNDPKFESTIDYIDINSQKRPLLVKLRREIFSAREQLLRRLHNFKFRFGSSFFQGCN